LDNRYQRAYRLQAHQGDRMQHSSNQRSGNHVERICQRRTRVEADYPGSIYDKFFLLWFIPLAVMSLLMLAILMDLLSYDHVFKAHISLHKPAAI
jgi:hypothetical protein